MKVDVRTVGAFQENTYFVVDETTNRAVLIDPGAEPEMLVAMVRESGAVLEAIWLTHGHIDHIGGIAGVQREWTVPVHMHPADQPLFARGASQAAMYGLPFDPPNDPDVALADGDRVSVGSLEFDVIHTPGHSPGHVVFRHGNTVFGGDLLFAGSIGRTDLPLSDPARMEESLARICELDDASVVHPGHGPRTTIGHERATNGFLTGAARIVKR
ncbi:MAG: beta-lactamase domain protein [Gemmatimonadetes bacterium]|nr:beta-lactamase domain protein [Gemmatimonadota bacterium]